MKKYNSFPVPYIQRTISIYTTSTTIYYYKFCKCKRYCTTRSRCKCKVVIKVRNRIVLATNIEKRYFDLKECSCEESDLYQIAISSLNKSVRNTYMPYMSICDPYLEKALGTLRL